MAHSKPWLLSSSTQCHTCGRRRRNKTKVALCWRPVRLTVVPIIFLFYNGQLLERLIETEKVDVDSKDSTGRTPLSWATEVGR